MPIPSHGEIAVQELGYGFQSSALSRITHGLVLIQLVPPEGLEPSVLGLRVPCFSRLSYGGIVEHWSLSNGTNKSL